MSFLFPPGCALLKTSRNVKFIMKTSINQKQLFFKFSVLRILNIVLGIVIVIRSQSYPSYNDFFTQPFGMLNTTL